MSTIGELKVLAEAQAARADQIARHERSLARLRVCTCAYPIIHMRNGHGHADTCPAARLIGDPPRREMLPKKELP